MRVYDTTAAGHVLSYNLKLWRHLVECRMFANCILSVSVVQLSFIGYASVQMYNPYDNIHASFFNHCSIVVVTSAVETALQFRYDPVQVFHIELNRSMVN